eukprot:4786154-Amphidinium_carterae.1
MLCIGTQCRNYHQVLGLNLWAWFRLTAIEGTVVTLLRKASELADGQLRQESEEHQTSARRKADTTRKCPRVPWIRQTATYRYLIGAALGGHACVSRA